MLALLLLTASGAGQESDRGCRTDADCSMLGVCSASSSTCRCSSGWHGQHCEQLNLAPVLPTGSGLDLLATNHTSTWGGPAIPYKQDTSRYHMLYSEMARGCGINSWLSNSEVRHAVSTDPLGDRLY